MKKYEIYIKIGHEYIRISEVDNKKYAEKLLKKAAKMFGHAKLTYTTKKGIIVVVTINRDKTK